MSTLTPGAEALPAPKTKHQARDFENTCEELRGALDKGTIGDIVAKHEKMIESIIETYRTKRPRASPRQG